MKKPLSISEYRKTIQNEISELGEETLPGKILQLAGSLIQKLTRQTNPPPWYVSTILLVIIAVIPQTLFAFIFKQPEQIVGNGLIWTASVLIVVPIIPIMYLILKYMLIIIRDHVIDSIGKKSDLDDLRSFLFEIGLQRKVFLQSLFAATLWSIIAIPVFSSFKKGFIGIGWSIDVWLWGFLALGIGLNFLLWFMKFPIRIRSYQFNLYELNPSRSELIIYLSVLFTRPFLASALYLAIGTFIASLFKVFIWVVFIVVIVFWIPLIMQFVNSQSAINKIISAKKWQTLNNLEAQIHEHWHKINYESVENTEAISKLMDLHERVYNSSNFRLTINSIFDILTQLVLPILTFFFSNLDSVMRFFN